MSDQINGEPRLEKPHLKPSGEGMVSLASAVQDRYEELCGLHRRTRHQEITIPGDLKNAARNLRDLLHRYRNRDFRHTDDEVKALKEFAQWTLDMNADLRNQPREVLECLRT